MILEFRKQDNYMQKTKTEFNKPNIKQSIKVRDHDKEVYPFFSV